MKILLTGAGGPAGRALYPQLVDRGVDVVRVDMAGGEGIVAVPPARHKNFISFINELVDTEGIDAVIPTVQEELPVFAAATMFVPVLISEPNAVAIADDKWLTYHALNRAGVSVPRSTTPGALDTRTLGWLGDRVISKPRRSRGGRGVIVHENPRADELATLPEDSIIQEFAPGEEYAPNVFVSNERTECVVLRKTALAYGHHGNAVATEVVDEPGIAQLAIDAARALNLRGPVDVDIRRRRDGTPVVLEINARFGANSAKAPVIVEAALELLANAQPNLRRMPEHDLDKDEIGRWLDAQAAMSAPAGEGVDSQ
ncbi:ATP-grasp domain-containing protein [Trueperella bialowiezensis]|uniref:Carbamoyl phosphate synthase-like protein n=1 Tax=Trueperella bialowiezensis TaxID=312285 RepID=A0A3S4YXI6_9ACTO|nr:ATP-grasp domain-containing protein [Trueperella bialowiezensis]VEI13004.1 carbamoyl phosphate synthase-like protein [Trueperella bialowiezensis]